MKDIEQFIKGFKVFQENYFGKNDSRFEHLKDGQNPKTMIIGCSDSRVDPALLTNSEPGDIFVVRNVANLVPPYEAGGGYHGVSAALEFAVCVLKVRNIVVLGHSQCGGINALMNENYGEGKSMFVSKWMAMASSVRDEVKMKLAGKEAALKQRAAEQAAILLSMENLHSFPFVAERIESSELSIYGFYFDLGSGDLYKYSTDKKAFEAVLSE